MGYLNGLLACNSFANRPSKQVECAEGHSRFLEFSAISATSANVHVRTGLVSRVRAFRNRYTRM